MSASPDLNGDKTDGESNPLAMVVRLLKNKQIAISAIKTNTFLSTHDSAASCSPKETIYFLSSPRFLKKVNTV